MEKMISTEQEEQKEEEEETTLYSKKLLGGVMLPNFLLSIEEFNSVKVPQVSINVMGLTRALDQKL